MLTRKQFEDSLRSLVVVSDRRDFPKVSKDEAGALTAIREALERLEAEPRLFSGDPNGDFTYEDPVLATLVMASRMHEKAFGTAKRAAKEGSDLTDFNPRFWSIPIKVLFDMAGEAWEMLGNRYSREPYKIDEHPLRLAVFADAGYFGTAQGKVIDFIVTIQKSRPFHAAIHLGDIYFAGGLKEIRLHFLASVNKLSRSLPVFSLCGNHDLYSGPGVYDQLLKELNQPGRYFHIRSRRWQIALLDTSLAAEVSILRRKFRNQGELDDGQTAWLQELLKTEGGSGTVLMSHHYFISGWDKKGSPTLKAQIGNSIKDKIAAWYWGHEHNCATYGKEKHGFFGACVGNGAFLEPWSEPSTESGCVQPGWYAQGRCTCYRKNNKNWPHGFLELELDDGKITETYHLENGENYTRALQRSDGSWNQTVPASENG
jgi:hypothetical protein